MFWKYAANLQDNTHAEVWFQKSCKIKLQNGGSIYRTPPGDCFSKVQLPRINVTEINECDNVLPEKELYMFFMSMPNNTSLGNGGLAKDFFIILWEDIKL